MRDTWLILPIELTAMVESLKGGLTGLGIWKVKMSVCWLSETNERRRLKLLMNSCSTLEVTLLDSDNKMAEIAIQALRSPEK